MAGSGGGCGIVVKSNLSKLDNGRLKYSGEEFQTSLGNFARRLSGLNTRFNVEGIKANIVHVASWGWRGGLSCGGSREIGRLNFVWTEGKL